MLVGARRVSGPFGCGAPIEPRFLQVRSGRAITATLVDDDTRTESFAAAEIVRTPTNVPLSRIGSFTWRADPNVYVDVFWGDIGEGLEYAPMVRYEWPFDELTPETERQFPSSDILSIDPRVVFDTKVPTSLRYYDRGACSGDLSWRALGDGVAEQFDAAIIFRAREGDPENPNDGGKCVVPISNWVITPILRDEVDGENRDAFRFTRTYGGVLCGSNIGTTLNFSWVGRFVPVSQSLVFEVEEVSIINGFGNHELADEESLRVELPFALGAAIPGVVGQVVRLDPSLPPLFECTPGEAPTQCAEDARDLFEPRPTSPNPCRSLCFGTPRQCISVCRGAIQDRNFTCLPSDEHDDGGACAFVPNFYRAHERPEGIEIVVSEWSADEELLGRGVADPLVDFLAVAGACDRTTPRPSPRVGYSGAVFEVPPLGTPLPFGDEP